jgi:endoglucanase
MKKTNTHLLSSCFVLVLMCMTGRPLEASAPDNALQRAPFTRGVNLTSWFEMWQPGPGNLKMYDEEDIRNIKSLGADIVRLPVHFDMLSSGAPEYKINETVWKYLDKAVDWCEKYQIHIVIDDHSFNGLPDDKYPSGRIINNHLQKVWPQVAARYKDRSDYVLYEILNEPQLSSAAEWNKIQGEALKTIRRYDTKHTVVVSGNEWSSAHALSSVKVYDDPGLIYTFHCYLPMTFTHQGASWAGRELEQLSGIPFPYDEKRMPPVPDKVKGTWMETELVKNYPADGNADAVRKELTTAKNFGDKNHVALWCGEMGAYDKNSIHEDRVRWYKQISSLLSELDIPFCVWGYGGSFGLFRKGSAEQYPYDLDADIVSAAGFTVPENAGTSAPRSVSVIRTPYVIFDDVGAKGVNAEAWNSGRSATSFADSDNPAEGFSCIRMSSYRRYNALTFRFNNPVSLADVHGTGAAVSFKMRSSHAVCADLRFIDDETAETKPWRMTYSITEKDCPADGRWHTVTVPLASMSESGAWCDSEQKWYGADNEFRWDCVRLMQFAAEKSDMPYDVYVDDIRIIQPAAE